MARRTPVRSYVFIPEQSPLLMAQPQFQAYYQQPPMPYMTATDTWAEKMPPALFYRSRPGRRR